MGNRFTTQGLGDKATRGMQDDRICQTESGWRPSETEIAHIQTLTNTPKCELLHRRDPSHGTVKGIDEAQWHAVTCASVLLARWWMRLGARSGDWPVLSWVAFNIPFDSGTQWTVSALCWKDWKKDTVCHVVVKYVRLYVLRRVEFEQEIQRKCAAGSDELIQHRRRHTQDTSQVHACQHWDLHLQPITVEYTLKSLRHLQAVTVEYTLRSLDSRVCACCYCESELCRACKIKPVMLINSCLLTYFSLFAAILLFGIRNGIIF